MSARVRPTVDAGHFSPWALDNRRLWKLRNNFCASVHFGCRKWGVAPSREHAAWVGGQETEPWGAGVGRPSLAAFQQGMGERCSPLFRCFFGARRGLRTALATAATSRRFTIMLLEGLRTQCLLLRGQNSFSTRFSSSQDGEKKTK